MGYCAAETDSGSSFLTDPSDDGVAATAYGSSFSTNNPNPLPKRTRCDPWLRPSSNLPMKYPDYNWHWDYNDMANQGPEILEYLQKNAEKAIEFYNTNNPGAFQGADFEAVEVLSFNEFISSSRSLHMNFKAKPKMAADDDHHSVRTFFAEMIRFDYLPPDLPIAQRVGQPFTCSLLEKGSAAASCNACPPSNGILHPHRGYYTGDPGVLYATFPPGGLYGPVPPVTAFDDIIMVTRGFCTAVKRFCLENFYPFINYLATSVRGRDLSLAR